MAEKGAHISATYLKKPSIFELIAQESLADTFYPALRRVVLVSGLLLCPFIIWLNYCNSFALISVLL